MRLVFSKAEWHLKVIHTNSPIWGISFPYLGNFFPQIGERHFSFPYLGNDVDNSNYTAITKKKSLQKRKNEIDFLTFSKYIFNNIFYNVNNYPQGDLKKSNS